MSDLKPIQKACIVSNMLNSMNYNTDKLTMFNLFNVIHGIEKVLKENEITLK